MRIHLWANMPGQGYKLWTMDSLALVLCLAIHSQSAMQLNLLTESVLCNNVM